jgi:predicted transcriptional regulator
MIELDLVSRKKDGRKVTFSLTELGQKLAKS